MECYDGLDVLARTDLQDNWLKAVFEEMSSVEERLKEMAANLMSDEA